MLTKKKKLWIWIGSAATLLIAAVVLICIFAFRAPDPAAILEESEKLSEQNLCLMAILEKNPEDAEAKKQLLANFKALEADPLTIYALEQTFGIPAQETQKTEPEQAGAIIGSGGIAKLEDFEGAYSVATAGTTIYYATDNGIFADYRGIRLCIGPARADQLLAAENGLYFLNLTQKRVQYIARDGHRIETLFPIDAQSFAFFDNKLWIAGTDGTLYCEGAPIETQGKVGTLSATKASLYATLEQQDSRAAGIIAINSKGESERILSSPAYSPFAGADGCLYYLDQNRYPCRYDPATKQATILLEEKARLITLEEDTVYFINEQGKIDEI